MANQVAVSNTQAVVGSFTQQELNTLKATIARGTTDEQFALFVQTCVSAGLNPFLNHIHCIVYNSQKNGPTMSIQIAVEGILSLARRTEGYKGIDAQLVHENDDFKFDASTKQITHSVGFPRGKVIGGYAVAKREGFEDVITLMEVDEVEHMLKGRNAEMWKTWFNDMFKKHLTKRVAKLQYGIEISEDESIGSNTVDETPSYQPNQRIDITPSQMEIAEGEVVNPEEELKKKWVEIKGKIASYDMTEEDLKVLIQEKFEKKAKDLNLQHLVALSKFVDMEYAARQKELVQAAQDAFNFDNAQL